VTRQKKDKMADGNKPTKNSMTYIVGVFTALQVSAIAKGALFFILWIPLLWWIHSSSCFYWPSYSEIHPIAVWCYFVWNTQLFAHNFYYV